MGYVSKLVELPVCNKQEPVVDFIGVATLFSFNFLYSCSMKTEFVLLGCQILNCGFIFPCCLYVEFFSCCCVLPYDIKRGCL